MKLHINTLIEWIVEGDPLIERILWIDSSGVDIATITIHDPQSLPIFKKFQDIESALLTGDARILERDPYSFLLQPEDAIPEKYRHKRDAAWDAIASLVEDPTGQIFFSSGRGALLQAQEKKTGRTKKTIYKLLRRYWQGGQKKNTLLPRFEECGGKGKERHSSNKKRGRPSKLAIVTNRPVGINIDNTIREKFRRGIQLFYKNSEKRTLQDAYQKTLEKFFHKGYDMLPSGTLVPSLPPADELPTFGQFRYWYEKERDITQTLSAREGNRGYNLLHREVLGNSTQMAFGPGSVYQIDATIGDVYLVSSLDRTRIIGRPVIYIVIDVFSRMIVGMSVTLEGPSWVGAMQALENTAIKKVPFCQEYGISISEAEWPSHQLPEMILADRGELEGYNADNLVNALNIRVSNTPPYRADWKGIVERNFRLSNDKVVHWVPGAVYQRRERGDRDYRLDAKLDLHEFRKLMILSILNHNLEHRMDWYKMDEFMIQQHVEPYPINLWNWGINNRAGHLRTVAPEILRLNLLPSMRATVTHRGIRCSQGLRYSCELALREQWFVKAREKGSWKIDVAYDPRNLFETYLRLDGGRRLERCQLMDVDQIFRSKDWYEVADYIEIKKQEKEKAKTRQQQSTAVLNAQMEQIITEATEKTDKQLEVAGKLSKRARLGSIRQNRKEEKEMERTAQAWKLGATDTSTDQSDKVVPLSLPNSTSQRTTQLGEAIEGSSQGTLQRQEENTQGDTLKDPQHVPPSYLIDKLRKLRAKKEDGND